MQTNDDDTKTYTKREFNQILNKLYTARSEIESRLSIKQTTATINSLSAALKLIKEVEDLVDPIEVTI